MFKCVLSSFKNNFKWVNSELMSDKEVVNKEELKLLREVAERSSDLLKGKNWLDFRKQMGGIKVLKEAYINSVLEYEGWLDFQDDGSFWVSL